MGRGENQLGNEEKQLDNGEYTQCIMKLSFEISTDEMIDLVKSA